MEHSFLNSFNIGDTFEGIYYLKSSIKKIAKNSNQYAIFVLKDKSGEVDAKLWDLDGCKIEIERQPRIFARIKGYVESYMGNPNFIIKEIEKVEKPTDLSNYVVCSPTIERDKDKFEKYIEKVNELCGNERTCALVLERVFNKEFKKKFFDSPNTTLPSYGITGGLLAHTIKMTSIAGGVISNYEFTNIEKAVLITASLLHGIGCTKAFDFIDCVSEFTEEGSMKGVNFISANMIEEIVKKEESEKLNHEIINKIIHAVLTYRVGHFRAKTKEAIVLSKIYELDNELVNTFDFDKK